VEVAPGEASLLEGSGVLRDGHTSNLSSNILSHGNGAEGTSSKVRPSGLFAGGHDSMWSDAGTSPQRRPSSLARAGASALGRGTGTNSSTLGRGISVASSTHLPHAASVLRHQSLRAVKHIPRVSKRELVEIMMKTPGPIEEFHRQVVRLRDLMIPYTLKGSVTYEDVKADKEGSGVYGARDVAKITYQHDDSFRTY